MIILGVGTQLIVYASTWIITLLKYLLLHTHDTASRQGKGIAAGKEGGDGRGACTLLNELLHRSWGGETVETTAGGGARGAAWSRTRHHRTSWCLDSTRYYGGGYGRPWKWVSCNICTRGACHLRSMLLLRIEDRRRINVTGPAGAVLCIYVGGCEKLYPALEP